MRFAPSLGLVVLLVCLAQVLVTGMMFDLMEFFDNYLNFVVV
jgi:hypothetical protein